MLTASRRQASRKEIPYPDQINKAWSPCLGNNIVGQYPRPEPSRLAVIAHAWLSVLA